MLWKTLINKIVLYVQFTPGDPGVEEIKRKAKEDSQYVWSYLERWDIRQAGALRALVPDAFPKKLRIGQLIATQNIHGAWRVDTQV